MKRLFALIIAIGVLCGCRNQSPPGADPFFGRTTVPPPPTGSATGRPADPYYRGTPGPSSSLAPVPQVQQPGVSLPPPSSGGGTRYEPPGGTFNYRGASAAGQSGAVFQPDKPVQQASASDKGPSRIRIIEPQNSPRPVDDTTEVATAAASAKAGTVAGTAATPEEARSLASDTLSGPLSGRPRVVRPLQPRPQPAESTPNSAATPLAVRPAAGVPQRAEISPKSVDIMDLPAAGSSASSAEARSRSVGGALRLVSGSAATTEPGGVVAARGVSGTETAEDGLSTAAGPPAKRGEAASSHAN